MCRRYQPQPMRFRGVWLRNDMDTWAIVAIIAAFISSNATAWFLGGRYKKIRFERDGERIVNDALVKEIAGRENAEERSKKLRRLLRKYRAVKSFVRGDVPKSKARTNQGSKKTSVSD